MRDLSLKNLRPGMKLYSGWLGYGKHDQTLLNCVTIRKIDMKRHRAYLYHSTFTDDTERDFLTENDLSEWDSSLPWLISSLISEIDEEMESERIEYQETIEPMIKERNRLSQLKKKVKT